MVLLTVDGVDLHAVLFSAEPSPKSPASDVGPGIGLVLAPGFSGSTQRPDVVRVALLRVGEIRALAPHDERREAEHAERQHRPDGDTAAQLDQLGVDLVGHVGSLAQGGSVGDAADPV